MPLPYDSSDKMFDDTIAAELTRANSYYDEMASKLSQSISSTASKEELNELASEWIEAAQKNAYEKENKGIFVFNSCGKKILEIKFDESTGEVNSVNACGEVMEKLTPSIDSFATPITIELTAPKSNPTGPINPPEHFPRKGHPSDACYDLFSPIDLVVFPGSTSILDLQIKSNTPPNMEIQIRGRSSLISKGFLASLGTVDPAYRGNIHVFLHNVGHYTDPITKSSSWHIKKGDRVCQMKYSFIPSTDLIPGTVDTNTDRSSNGIGSTGA